jgi:ParB family chromosome partitioning protein
LRVERGYVRPEDEPAVTESEPQSDTREVNAAVQPASADSVEAVDGDSLDQEESEDDGIKPIPDRLLTEFKAYQTLALRDALGQNPDLSFLVALHALCLKLFYVEIDAKSIVLGSQAPGLNDSAIAKAIDDRHRRWSKQLPQESDELWDALLKFDVDSRHALFAHCVGLSINAVHESWNRRPRALAHADRVAETDA